MLIVNLSKHAQSSYNVVEVIVCLVVTLCCFYVFTDLFADFKKMFKRKR